MAIAMDNMIGDPPHIKDAEHYGMPVPGYYCEICGNPIKRQVLIVDHRDSYYHKICLKELAENNFDGFLLLFGADIFEV